MCGLGYSCSEMLVRTQQSGCAKRVFELYGKIVKVSYASAFPVFEPKYHTSQLPLLRTET